MTPEADDFGAGDFWPLPPGIQIEQWSALDIVIDDYAPPAHVRMAINRGKARIITAPAAARYNTDPLVVRAVAVGRWFAVYRDQPMFWGLSYVEQPARWSIIHRVTGLHCGHRGSLPAALRVARRLGRVSVDWGFSDLDGGKRLPEAARLEIGRIVSGRRGRHMW